jgi:hypothetical protein
MTTPGLGITPESNNNQNALVEQKVRIEQALKGSASWFLMIAGLSVVNSVLSMTETGIRFIFGLGITQVVDAVAHQAGSAGLVLDLIINGMIAGVLILFWNFARKGQKWAWITGMGLYLIDGIILLLFKDYLAVAFHAYALYRMSNGMKLLSAFEQVNKQASSGSLSSSM